MPSPKDPLSPLCFACPTCGVAREIGCRTGRGEPTGAHATREALGVACPLPGCLAPAGRACTGAIPGHGRHHPERLYRARGQAAPGFARALQQHVEALYRLLLDNPEAVVEALLFITVRDAAQLPPEFFGNRRGNETWRYEYFPGEPRELRVSIRVQDKEATAEPQLPGNDPAELPELQQLPLALPGSGRRGPLLLPPVPSSAHAAAQREEA